MDLFQLSDINVAIAKIIDAVYNYDHPATDFGSTGSGSLEQG